MSLTVASTFARRGRQTRAIHPVALSSIGSAVSSQCRQQTRTYRFGRLSSCLNQYISPDTYTRHHVSGYNKYCDNLYKRPSNGKHSLAEDTKATLKRVVNNCWHPSRRAGQGAGRNLNTEAGPRRTPDNPEGIRPGQNIEDVERAPLEHLLFGDKQSQPGKMQGRAGMSGNTDADYIIDPISNRKVPRKLFESGYLTSEQGIDVPVKTCKSYKPQFEPFKAPEVEVAQVPYFSDGPPPESELKMYGQQKLWDPVTQSDHVAPSSQKRPAVNHYGAPQSTLLDTLSWEHKELRWHRNDTLTSASANASWLQDPATPQYTDLHQYTAVRYQEPDGKPSGEQAASPPEELDQYSAVRAHEPDGKYKVDSESPVDPQELGKYDAVRSHEPDGKYKLASEPAAKPEELSHYRSVWSHEPNGKYAAEYTEAPDQAELDAYSKPFMAHEPDGMYATHYRKPEYDADELAKYRTPFFSHEPDGKYAAAYAEPQRDKAELSQYKAFRSHEPDGKYAASYVEEKPERQELASYGAFRSHEPDGKYAAANAAPAAPADTGKYQAFRSHEPDGKYAAANAAPAAPADTGKYQAFRSHEPDGKYATRHVEEKPEDDLANYGPFRSHEPDGKYAAEAAVAKEADDLANHEAFGYEDAETRPLPQESRSSESVADLEGYRTPKLDESVESAASFSGYEDYDPAELRKYQAVRWNEPDGKPAEPEAAEQAVSEYNLKGGSAEQKTSYCKKEELMAQAATESGEATGSTTSLTGNYVRDFPEEFSKSWPSNTAQDTTALLSPEQKESDKVVQPALERCTSSSNTGPGAGSGASTQSSQPPNPAQPALYKILVYDPTMQCIDAAETTSIVPDTAAPLTPAEVLLRISNPAKFFPHFAPLQAQGFEIVSGSGDVLIFRKVREASAAAESTPQENKAAPATATATAAINPIDMTGERQRRDEYTVAAGRFASPTGFVNYDLPPARASEREEVHRKKEASSAWDGGESRVSRKGRRSLPKKVAVGAAYLAGGAYSVGVVSEYFKKGGVDGKGHKGF